MADGALVLGVGARAGLGGALCRGSPAKGWRAFPLGRTAASVEAVAAEVRQGGGGRRRSRGDCTCAADVERGFDTVAKETGAPPRLVVYNAGQHGGGGDRRHGSRRSSRRRGASARSAPSSAAARPCGGWRPPAPARLLFTGATASLRARPPFTAFASAKAAERALAQGLARELGPAGVHVAHVVVDGVIDGDQVNARIPQLKERLGADGMLSVDALADAYWMLHAQPRSAWTFELDLRPYKESF